MPSRDRDTISGNLQKKGFVLSERDHKYFSYHSKNGKKTCVFTKISHGTKYKVISDNLLAQMSKQCKLSKADFLELIDCPLTRDLYEMKLQSQAIKLE
jgi:predicted transcriptional regulator